MIQVKVVNKINFPDITLQENLEYIAKNIIIPDIIRGIDDSMAITGMALPPLEPATIKRKWSNKPLIETGKLRSSFYFKPLGKNKVLISIAGDRKEIGGYLQVDGVGKKKKHFNFFGISVYASETAIEFIKKQLIGRLKGGNTKK